MLSSYHFQHTIKVRYSEIDRQNVVFNAHYVTYLEMTMIEYFRKVLGEDYFKLADRHFFEVVLVNITLKFLRPAKLDDNLTIYCKVNQLGNTNLHVSFVMYRSQQESVLSADAIYVNYNTEQGESQPIPNEVKEKIERFEHL